MLEAIRMCTFTFDYGDTRANHDFLARERCPER
jgi:hypothetical protein